MAPSNQGLKGIKALLAEAARIRHKVKKKSKSE
jgi:hypothetical protein